MRKLLAEMNSKVYSTESDVGTAQDRLRGTSGREKVGKGKKKEAKFTTNAHIADGLEKGRM